MSLRIFEAFVAATNGFCSINCITTGNLEYNSKPMTDLPFHLPPFQAKNNYSYVVFLLLSISCAGI